MCPILVLITCAAVLIANVSAQADDSDHLLAIRARMRTVGSSEPRVKFDWPVRAHFNYQLCLMCKIKDG